MEKIEKPFLLELENHNDFTEIRIRFHNTELNELIKVLNDDKLMSPICKVVDNSALGKALIGSTYCASCKDRFSNFAVRHQFQAKNWVRAMAKAFWFCGGVGYSLSRGSCPTSSAKIEYH